MKILLIGGTGTISMAVTRQLVAAGEEVYLLNRGHRTGDLPAGTHSIVADINDEAAVREALGNMTFDAVGQFIAFRREQVERDVRLFAGRTRQYIFISSSSAYHKPVAHYKITEGTALANPYWEMSRRKIECEQYLLHAHQENGFPVTIVRPSYTYDERSVPLGVRGPGSWQVLKRMLEGKPVIIQGDGTSLWTMTHNSDFAKGYCGLIGNVQAIGEAFHITSDEVLTWDQIYQCVADALGVPLHAVHVSTEFLHAIGPYDFKGTLLGDKSNSVVFDNSKLKAVVPSYQATVSFSEGMRRTVGNILAHPELQEEDPAFDAWCDRVIDGLEQLKNSLRRENGLD